jgi:hypothetical protein
MSPADARRASRSIRHLCAGCRVQRAMFRFRGVVRADCDHMLCFRCFRSERERQRDRLLAAVLTRTVKAPRVVGIRENV